MAEGAEGYGYSFPLRLYGVLLVENYRLQRYVEQIGNLLYGGCTSPPAFGIPLSARGEGD